MSHRLVTILFFICTAYGAHAQFIPYSTDFESPVSNLFSWQDKLWVSTTDNGLYMSQDGGQTWLKNWELNYEGNINRLENNGVLHVNQVVVYQNQLWGCTDHGLYRSLDEGRNWQLVKNFKQLNPDYNSLVDVPVMQLVFSPGKAIGLLKNGSLTTSLDGGATWSEPFTSPEAAADSPKQTPRQFISWSDNKWYLLTAKRLLVSIDDAQTWTPLSLSVGNGTATAVSVESNNLAVGASDDVFEGSSYAGKKVCLYTSRDGGQTWSQTDFAYKGLGGLSTPIEVNITSAGGRFYASAIGDVWATTSTSSVWTSYRSGIPPREANRTGVNVQANLLINNERLYTILVEPSPLSQYVFYYKLYSRPLAELEPSYFAAPALPVVSELVSFTNVLSWQDVSEGEDNFEIERAEQSTTLFQPIARVAAGVTSFRDSQVQAGVSYYYRIRAQKGTTYSAYSPVVKSLRSNDCVQVNELASVRRAEQPTPVVLYALSGTELIKSLDGGKQWQTLDICDADNALYADLSFPTAEMGYVMTRNRPNLFRTRDGGNTWTRLLPKLDNMNLESFSVHFVNDSVGYMLAKPAGFASYYTLYKTTNGGYSFDQLPTGPHFLLDDYGLYLNQRIKPSFIGNSTIVGLTEVVNNNNSILSRLAISTDGGATWQKHLLPAEGTIVRRLYAISADDIWLFASSHLVYKNSDDVFHTTNGGASWTKISLPDRVDDRYHPINIYDIRFTDSQRGLIIGGKSGDYSDHGPVPSLGYVYRTTDGGTTWETLTTGFPIGFPLTVLSMRGEQVAAFGDGGENRIDRLTATSANLGTSWEKSSDLDNTTPYSISFRTPKEGYMVGQPSPVPSTRVNYYHKTKDGGVSWQRVYLPEAEKLFEVYFLNTTMGFLTTQDAVWVTSDGGQSWQRKPTPAPFLPLRIYTDGDTHQAEKFAKSYFINASTWLRISTTNQVFKTSDGGDSWVQLPTPVFTDTPIFSFVDTKVGFCTGEQGGYKGQVYRTIDGGQTWGLVGQASRNGFTVRDMYFTDGMTGFINDIGLHVTHDAGKTWHNIPTISDRTLAFTFFNTKVGYLGGLYKTIDGGETWTKLPKRLTAIWPVAVLNETTAYALNTSIRQGSLPCNLVPYSGDTIACKSAGQLAVVQLGSGSGSNPLRYQWYKLPENTPVPGQTSSTLSLTDVAPYDIRSYYCIASNGCGTTTSRNLIVSGEQVVYTLKAGNWADPSLWSCNRLPTSRDRVVLKHVITIPDAYKAYASRLEFNSDKASLRYNSQSKLLFNTP